MTPVELIRTIVNLGIEANREEGGLTDMDQVRVCDHICTHAYIQTLL